MQTAPLEKWGPKSGILAFFLRSGGVCAEGWCPRSTDGYLRKQRLLWAKTLLRLFLLPIQLALDDLGPKALLTFVGTLGAEFVVLDFPRIGVDEEGHLPTIFM